MEIEKMKREIKRMIDELNDPEILKQVYDMLKRAADLRDSMIESALEAQEDIKAGRVYTPAEFKTHMKAYIYKR
jgi:hypothetical protein